MLQALDAVGVHLIVIAVVVMDDALKVAALPHLLLHMHTRWFTITCRGNSINNNNDNIVMITTMAIMIMKVVLIMIIMIIDNNNAETITMITEDSNTDNSNNGKR